MTSRKRPSRSLPLLTLALAACITQPAAAGSVQVSPNQLDVRASAGDALPPVTLTNTGSSPVLVDVTARAAKQALTGLPEYDTSADALAAGWRRISVEPRRLVIPPGERRTVTATVQLGSRKPGRYGVLLFTARGQDAASGGVATAVRIATNVLLRYPGFVTTTGAVTGVRAEQGDGPRTLRIVARVQNSGNLHTRASSLLAIVAPDGRVVHRQELAPGIVLPGVAREFPAEVRTLLPAGAYTARVTSDVGGVRTVREERFELVAPNTLPTPAIKISRLRRPDADANEPYDVDMTIRNTGTAPLRPGASLHLHQSGDGAELGRRRVDLPAIAPGDQIERSVRMPPVKRGEYELDLRLRDGERMLDERRVGFDTEDRLSWWDRLRDLLARHLELVLTLGGLLVVAAVAVAVASASRSRRRLRELEAQQPASPAEREPALPV